MNTVQDYIAQLTEERKIAIEKLRQVILANLPQGFEETISYGMIAYVVPHTIYPAGYHCDTKTPLPFISLASQKNFIALYHMGIYANEEIKNWFVREYPQHCTTKLDMGKSCIRFKNIDKIPYNLIGKLATKMTWEQWVDIYEMQIRK